RDHRPRSRLHDLPDSRGGRLQGLLDSAVGVTRGGAAVIALGAAFLVAGCGTGGIAKGGDASRGETVFQQKCGSCQTLADAGTSGKVGPNLDQLMPAFARVQKQVINGGAVMPAFKGKLTPAQIKAVAKYVSSAAGKH